MSLSPSPSISANIGIAQILKLLKESPKGFPSEGPKSGDVGVPRLLNNRIKPGLYPTHKSKRPSLFASSNTGAKKTALLAGR